MDILQAFMAYAGDFERTYVDDDWTRLRRYFTDDALYEVEARTFGCSLQGPAAIFAGIRKSLDGFDRRFATRHIAVVDGPEVAGDEMRVGWTVTYGRAGVPPFVLRGRSTVRFRDGLIARLTDSYEPAAERELAEWRRSSGMAVDVSYV